MTDLTDAQFDEQVDEAYDSIAIDATSGVERMTHGDRSLQKYDLKDRLEALQMLDDRRARINNTSGLRLTICKPGGTG